MSIGDLPAKDIPRKIIKNCSFAKLNPYEPSKVCRPRNQICAKNNPLQLERSYDSPTVLISYSKERCLVHLSSRLTCYTGVILDMS